MTHPLIEIEGLGRDYRLGDHLVRALDAVSLAIPQGAFVAVMGPSGSGKSTFMNLIGCLDTPTRGRYRLDGTDTAALDRGALARVRNRAIGFVFQSFNLLARTSAAENVALPLLYSDVPRRQRAAMAAAALDAVGLTDRAHHLPSQLSGGQQQRVAIARAIVNRPALILADEPTGALDSRTGAEIMALFQRLNQGGITIIVVTHEEEVACYARRILRFHDGRLIADEANPAPRAAA